MAPFSKAMWIEIENEKDIDVLDDLLRHLVASGRKVYIEVGVKKRDASNRKFHALCRRLAFATGYSPAEIKSMVKMEVIGCEDSIRMIDDETLMAMIEKLECWIENLEA